MNYNLNMDKIILDTMRTVAEKKIHNILAQFSFDKDSGYFTENEDYSHQIGLALKLKHISFQSQYDMGYGHIDPKNPAPYVDADFEKYYKKLCQERPSELFLANRFSIEEQRHYILQVFNHFNFKKCLNNVTTMTSIDHILRDLKEVGLNCLYINPEINCTFRELFKKHKVHTNHTLIFSYRGYWFEEDVLKHIEDNFMFKNKWNEFLERNQSNYSKYQHLILSNTLDNKKSVGIKQKI